LISIIDYGVGNLRSVEKAFHFIGCEAKITSDENAILSSSAVVLPGVGAFADAMISLEKTGMLCTVKKVIDQGIPFLGICLGMQLLFEYSEEGGEKVAGLGILKGGVKQFPLDMNLKIPHMGWNSLNVPKKSLLFESLPSNPYVYFVHSYYVSAAEKSTVAATCNYGIEFDAAIEINNIFATQFHPEKSGEVGLKILKNFAALN